MELLRPAVIFVVVVLSALANGYDKCKSDLANDSPYQKEYAGKCYVVFSKKSKQYKTAEKMCKDGGGSLAMPKTQGVNDVLTNLLVEMNTGSRFWIGLDDIKYESVFLWVDGSKFDKNVFNNFAPNNGPGRSFFSTATVEDCVAIGTDGKWHDFSCDWGILESYWPYVCEYDADVSVTTPSPTTATTGCPLNNNCNLNCGFDGYKSKNGCFICECAD